MLSRFFKSRLRPLYEGSLTLQELRFRKILLSVLLFAPSAAAVFMGCQVFPGPKKAAGKVLADGKLNAHWRSKSSWSLKGLRKAQFYLFSSLQQSAFAEKDAFVGPPLPAL